jgi:murein DD-endopeptidase MepM/ murein hydrolase activator NlpD
MKFKKLLTIILVTIIFLVQIPVGSRAASCPSYMDPSSIECLDYLREQLDDLSKKNNSIKNQLSDEEYKQLSLSQKLEYIANQIVQTEKVIQSLEIELAAHNIEIGLLEDEIEVAEDSIALSRQEISQLENTVNQRITESYKYSFVGALELFLDINGLDDILRKTKYLITTREKDTQQLEQYTNLVEQLEKKEQDLTEQRTELQAKRLKMEEQQDELLVEKNNLDSQKAERERLLAESKRKAAALEAQYIANTKKLSDLDAAIIDYINKYGDKAVNSGYVSTGTWIGRMGNSGLSGGDHLHFSLNDGSAGICTGNIPILSGYLTQGEGSWIVGWDGWRWPYMYAGTLPMPIAGPKVIMSQNYHQGMAIDLISYKLDYTKNLGAPIYAVMSGELYKGVDNYGGKYAYIIHSNGWISCYLHLQ